MPLREKPRLRVFAIPTLSVCSRANGMDDELRGTDRGDRHKEDRVIRCNVVYEPQS